MAQDVRNEALVSVLWPPGAASTGSTANLPDVYSGFYAIVAVTNAQEELLYIGMAYEQSIKSRVDERHDSYGTIEDLVKARPQAKISVRPGIIASTGREAPTEKLFRDIECALIFCNQPELNTACKDAYNGPSIMVHNEGGFAPLEQRTFYFN